MDDSNLQKTNPRLLYRLNALRLLHQIGTELYFLGVKIASLWHKKAKLFMEGRKYIWNKVQDFNPGNNDVFWFHCASLGEFEQARPLIEQLKKDKTCKIVVTFFSPSGYEIRKNYSQADLIIYLPKDSKSNATRFLNHIKPTKIFFIKYEFWPNFLLEAQKKQIPTFLVSGVFRENQIFFKWYGGFMRTILKSFSGIFLQNENSKTLLDSIKIKSKLIGDTRFDRVMENAESVKPFPFIERFIDNKQTIVVGSCWAEDEVVVFPVLNEIANLKIIIAPHELGETHFKSIESNLTKKTIRYSQLKNSQNASDFDVLIIDNIGMLMHLYQYATVSYIGGAYGKGLHNILEPASFGVPVIFGNKYAKFPEAFQFIDEKIGFSINNPSEFKNILNDLLKKDLKSDVLHFMNNHKGATDKILTEIF